MRRPPSRRVARVPVLDRPVSFDLMSAGRLANCMHQVAATVGIARSRGVDPAFPADWVYRDVFSLPDHWYRDDLSGCVPADRLATSLPPAMRPYLQSLGLWADVVDEVRAVLAWSTDARRTIDMAFVDLVASMSIPDRPIGAIHVRRGDTVTRNRPDTIQPLPADYFVAAMDAMGRMGHPRSFVAFTDDPVWVRTHLPGVHVFTGEPGPEDTDPDYLTRPRRDWVDLGVMAHIVADGGWLAMSNSSYSWWAAWLGGAPSRVFYPSRWYGPVLLARGFDVSLIIDPAWHVIETI